MCLEIEFNGYHIGDISYDPSGHVVGKPGQSFWSCQAAATEGAISGSDGTWFL